jgi:hypothetical protein
MKYYELAKSSDFLMFNVEELVKDVLFIFVHILLKAQQFFYVELHV